jgi:hypothetical protein
MAPRFAGPSGAQATSATDPASVLRSATSAATILTGRTAPTASTSCEPAAGPTLPRRARAAAGRTATPFAASSTGNQNAVRRSVTAVAYVGSTAASIAVGAEFVTAIAAAVETAAGSGCIAPNEHHQPLSRCDWNNGINAAAIGFGGTRALSSASNNLDLRHMSRHGEILRSARVIKRVLARNRVRRTADRLDAVTSVAAAACKHGNAHAET